MEIGKAILIDRVSEGRELGNTYNYSTLCHYYVFLSEELGDLNVQRFGHSAGI